MIYGTDFFILFFEMVIMIKKFTDLFTVLRVCVRDLGLSSYLLQTHLTFQPESLAGHADDKLVRYLTWTCLQQSRVSGHRNE